MIEYDFICFNMIQERWGSYQYESGLAVYFPIFFGGQALLFSWLDSGQPSKGCEFMGA